MSGFAARGDLAGRDQSGGRAGGESFGGRRGGGGGDQLGGDAMNACTRIGEVVPVVLSRILQPRGDLPERVRCTRDTLSISAGTVLTWDETRRAYAADCGWLVLSSCVRRLWGHSFGPAPASQLQLLEVPPCRA